MKSLSFKIVLSILTISFFLFNTACKKETIDTVKPVLTIGEPAEGTIFTLTDDPEVHIEFTVTDETSLHELSVEVKDASGAVIYTDAPSVHDLKLLDYHEHFEPTGITGEVSMTLTVTAEDHGANVTTQTVNFKVKP
jgi:hypothetical protein